MQDRLLTPRDVAERLNVSRRTAYEMLSPEGPLGPYRIKIGRKVLRIKQSDLDRILDNGGVCGDNAS